MKTLKSNGNIARRAKKILVGGVNSPVRAFRNVDMPLLPVRRGRGAKIFDYNGKGYIDYVLSFGALALGHADAHIVRAVKKAVEKGAAFGATSSGEVELAELIKEAIPFAEKIRFVNSGTEAVMGAIRLARGHTGRKRIVKLANSYHGHADYLLAKAGSGLAAQNIPLSEGVPKEFLAQTIVLSDTNINLLDAVFKRYNEEIAALIVEPVGGNYGVTKPDVSFLKTARRLTKYYGSLFIFDEVITGFRFHYGSAADIFGVKPDIICLGKIIGGGLPIGAFGGPKKIMAALAPEGRVYQASTFAGNPVVMAAGTAALKRIARVKRKYPQLGAVAGQICRALELGAHKKNIAAKATCYGPMFSVRFGRKRDFRRFYKKLLRAGIYLVPSEYEANFVSFAHTEDDVEKTTRAIRLIFKEWNRRRR